MTARSTPANDNPNSVWKTTLVQAPPAVAWRVTGGGVRNESWLQATADALGAPLEIAPDAAEGVGPSLLALRALGVDTERRPVRTVVPDPRTIERLHGRLTLFRELSRLVAPGGLLCTGHAEPLDAGDGRFERSGPGGYFLYRRAGMPVQREEQADIPIHIMPNGDTAGARGAAIEALVFARKGGLL